MYKHLISSLLAGVILYCWGGASAQGTARAPDREVLFGSGLSKVPYLLAQSNELSVIPAILLKKPLDKSTRRYSFRLRIDNDYFQESLIGLGPASQGAEGDFGLTLALGAGKEWRYWMAKNAAFYAGGELSAIFHFSRRRYFSENLQSLSEPHRTFEEIKSGYVPGVGFNVFAGFRIEPVPRISLSVEAGPGIYSMLFLGTSNSIRTTSPGTPSELQFENRYTDASLRFRAGFLTPVFVMAGFSF